MLLSRATLFSDVMNTVSCECCVQYTIAKRESGSCATYGGVIRSYQYRQQSQRECLVRVYFTHFSSTFSIIFQINWTIEIKLKAFEVWWRESVCRGLVLSPPPPRTRAFAVAFPIKNNHRPLAITLSAHLYTYIIFVDSHTCFVDTIFLE